MPYKVPWSNFHELNLDWLLGEVKTLRTDVDDMMGSATPSDVPPLADGTADAGTSINYSRGDHVHPTDTSRASASALTAETTDRQDADLLLSGRIDTLSARVVPSDAYPLMDGAAESGSNVEYSRRDHRHPTDTSRAAASDLTQEITDRGNADNTLQTNIDAVDAKIKFSAAAPLMDSSSASPGFSDYQARADHVHPTDTSRASQDDFNTLKARVDAFEGSSNPSDATPLMDGVGAAGTGGNYSRGDHVHPSDTSKLDVAGGTITGNLTVDGNLKQTKLRTAAEIQYTGWYRVASIPNVAGSCIKLHIQRKGVSSETHEVTFAINSSSTFFSTDYSSANLQIITKIRYTNAGAVDIYVDQSLTSDVLIEMERYAATEAAINAMELVPITSVDAAPLGETIITTYDIELTATDPFRFTTATDISSFTAFNLTCSSISGFVGILHNNNNAIFQFYVRVNLNITARTGSGGGFEFDLPFDYNGPTADVDIGRQSQKNDEVIYAVFTNGSRTVRIRTTESFSNISTGSVRYSAPLTTIFNQ